MPPRSAVTLTSDLQNLIGSSVDASEEYSLSVLSKLFEVVMRHHGNNICSRLYNAHKPRRTTHSVYSSPTMANMMVHSETTETW